MKLAIALAIEKIDQLISTYDTELEQKSLAKELIKEKTHKKAGLQELRELLQSGSNIPDAIETIKTGKFSDIVGYDLLLFNTSRIGNLFSELYELNELFSSPEMLTTKEDKSISATPIPKTKLYQIDRTDYSFFSVFPSESPQHAVDKYKKLVAECPDQADALIEEGAEKIAQTLKEMGLSSRPSF